MYLDRAKEQFRQLLQIRGGRGDVKACPLQDVENFEKDLGVTLPKAYKEFLLWMGEGGGVFADFEFELNYVRNSNWNSANRIIRHYGCHNNLPDDAVIILVFQDDDAFVFIRTSEGDNPPVHALIPTEHGPEWKWNYARNIEAFCLMYINPLVGT